MASIRSGSIKQRTRSSRKVPPKPSEKRTMTGKKAGTKTKVVKKVKPKVASKKNEKMAAKAGKKKSTGEYQLFCLI